MKKIARIQLAQFQKSIGNQKLSMVEIWDLVHLDDISNIRCHIVKTKTLSSDIPFHKWHNSTA